MPRTPAPQQPPVALTVAGSDSGGGAGVQADVKTMEAHGAFATSVVTAVTAQHTRGVESSHDLPPAEVQAQLDAVTGDFEIGAAKTGMLATPDLIQVTTEFASSFDAPLVVDPVMVATSGDRLLDEDAETAYEDLLEEATLVTPNTAEAEVLTDVAVTDEATAIEAGRRLVEMGATAALVTGGHLGTDEVVHDVLVTDSVDPDGAPDAGTVDAGPVDGGAFVQDGPVSDGGTAVDGMQVFTKARVETDATHGSGCTLSAAIAARLAHGDDLETAVAKGIETMARAVRYPLNVGTGPGAVHHMAPLRAEARRAETAEAVRRLVRSFVELDVSPLVPEVGMNVVGAVPLAETTMETAAVDGRITDTLDGVARSGDIRFGASGHMARFLLAVREYDPERRFACNVQFSEPLDPVLSSLDWETTEIDRADQPPAVAAGEGSTMQWAARESFAGGTPAVVYDRGAFGKEPMCRLTARSADALESQVRTLVDGLAGQND